MSNCPYKTDLVQSGSFLSVCLSLWSQDKTVLNRKDNVKHHGIIKEMSFPQPKSITKILIHYLSSLNTYVPPSSIHTLKHSYQCVSTINFDLENVIQDDCSYERDSGSWNDSVGEVLACHEDLK